MDYALEKFNTYNELQDFINISNRKNYEIISLFHNQNNKYIVLYKKPSKIRDLI